MLFCPGTACAEFLRDVRTYWGLMHDGGPVCQCSELNLDTLKRPFNEPRVVPASGRVVGGALL